MGLDGAHQACFRSGHDYIPWRRSSLWTRKSVWRFCRISIPRSMSTKSKLIFPKCIVAITVTSLISFILVSTSSPPQSHPCLNPFSSSSSLQELQHNDVTLGRGVSHHWQLDCLLNILFEQILKKRLRSISLVLCEGNPPLTGGFHSQSASNAKIVTMSWRIM